MIIFISNKHLSAININKSGISEYISLEGNSVMDYTTPNDIETFCKYVLDYFSIEKFSDINLSVFLVDFGAARANINFLYQHLNEVIFENIIDAKSVLPVLLLKEVSVQPNTKYNISSFGKTYQICVDEDYNCNCEECSDMDSLIEITEEKYTIPFNFNCSGMIADGKKYSVLEEKYQPDISKLNAEKQELLAKIENLKKTKENELNTLKKQLIELTLKLERIKKYTNRSLCIFESKKIHSACADVASFAFRTFSSTISTPTYSIKYISNDNDLIKKDDIICEVTKRREGEKISTQLIKAETSGRVFYMRKNNSKIEDGDCVAVIGADYDTRAEAMAWYEENKLI